MSNTLLSVDLDWLNGAPDPVSKLNAVLRHVPPDVPAIMTIEHHEFLPQLRRWIKAGKVATPFNILNLDEHHDYYIHRPPYDQQGTEINCGVWGYRLPSEWYSKYTWVHNYRSELWDWEKALSSMAKRSISLYRRRDHRLGSLKSKIVAVVFCVSPDYLDYDMWDKIAEVIEIVVRRFKLPKAPIKIKEADISQVNGWRIAHRHLKVRQ